METPSFLVNDLVLRGTPRNKVHPKVTSSSSRPPYTSLSARQIQSLSTSSFHGDAEATKNGVEDRYVRRASRPIPRWEFVLILDLLRDYNFIILLSIVDKAKLFKKLQNEC